jgi:MFS superfamily sulfate permease-like transporter
VLALGIGLSAVLDLADSHGVDVVGTLPKGLPSIGFPDVGVSSLWILLPSAAGIVLVAYSEALGVAQSFAQKHGYEIDANRELGAHGVVNAASGLIGGLVGAGGMSASAVNEGAGARSQMSGVVASAMAVVTVLFLTPLFTDLPEAVLAALVLHAVSHMLKWRSLQRVWNVSRREFWPALAAVLGVVLIDVLQGLIIAVVLSLLLVVYRSSRPAVVALGALPQRPDTYVAVSRNPGAIVDPGVLVVRLDAAMYYANSVPNRDAVKALVRASDGLRAVVVDVEVQHDLDLTTMETLAQLVDWATAQHVDVYFAAVHADLRQRLDETGLTDHVGADRLHPTVAAAVDATRRSGSPGPQAG